MPAISGIRKPAVAGMFYPSERNALAQTVDGLLAACPDMANAATVRMLLAPHAGYMYSGAVAARGFHRVRAGETHPSRAFIIGPSHVEAFDYTSVYGGSAYRTPLGDVPVDASAAAALTQLHPSIRVSGAGHDVRAHDRGEHAIEVELPFLQRAIAGIRVVPITMGLQSWDACDALGNALADIVDWSADIVIASSDLSHFYDDATARKMDAAFCATMLTMDARSLYDRAARRECEACGTGPVVAALIASTSLRDRKAELVATANSGDINHDRTSVVGYASAVVTGEPA
jgi:AmmeMemoRadiSam system protein B